MSVDISSLAYALRKAEQANPFHFHHLPHGHALELIAAALGYGSHAAYKAAVTAGAESADLTRASDIVIQEQLVFARTNALNSMASGLSRLTTVLNAFKACLPDVRLWQNEATLHQAFSELLEKLAIEHQETQNAMAETGGEVVNEVCLPLSFSLLGLPAVGTSHQVDMEGRITMEIDRERRDSGRKINVRASFVLERLGAFVLARPVFEVESATLVAS